MDKPTFSPPGPAFNASKAKGMTIMSIPIQSNIPFIADVDKVQAAIAHQLGIHYIECTNQGQVSEWVRCMKQAISRHVDLIILSQLPNPADLQPQIKAARKAGIDVISTHGPNPKVYPPGTVPAAGTANLNLAVPGPFLRVYHLLADWVAVHAPHGEADTLIIAPFEVLGAKGEAKITRNRLKKDCPQCKTKIINVPLAQWSTKLRPQVKSELTKDPNINYIIPIYDGGAQQINTAIKASGRSGKVHQVSYNGAPAALKLIKSGSMQMDIGESVGWLAMAFMDDAMRVLVHAPVVHNEHTAIRVYTAKNVSAAGTPPKFDAGFGNSYIRGYSKLWGLKTPLTLPKY
jgi:ribose transport system substrate-binding protein